MSRRRQARKAWNQSGTDRAYSAASGKSGSVCKHQRGRGLYLLGGIVITDTEKRQAHTQSPESPQLGQATQTENISLASITLGYGTGKAKGKSFRVPHLHRQTLILGPGR